MPVFQDFEVPIIFEHEYLHCLFCNVVISKKEKEQHAKGKRHRRAKKNIPSSFNEFKKCEKDYNPFQEIYEFHCYDDSNEWEEVNNSPDDDIIIEEYGGDNYEVPDIYNLNINDSFGENDPYEANYSIGENSPMDIYETWDIHNIHNSMEMLSYGENDWIKNNGSGSHEDSNNWEELLEQDDRPLVNNVNIVKVI